MIICFHIVKWFQEFSSNTNNLTFYDLNPDYSIKIG